MRCSYHNVGDSGCLNRYNVDLPSSACHFVANYSPIDTSRTSSAKLLTIMSHLEALKQLKREGAYFRKMISRFVDDHILEVYDTNKSAVASADAYNNNS